MADFKHPFIDFSQGEVSEKLLLLSTSLETKNALSKLQNAYTTKTKGVARRTGTIKGPTTQFVVSSSYDNVRSIPFFIGEDLSFIAMVYVTTRQNQIDASLETEYLDTGNDLTGTFFNLTFDFFKVEGSGAFGDTERYLNSRTLTLDPAQDFTSFFQDLIVPQTNSLAWTDLYGLKFTSFQNLVLFCHETGSVEPFFFRYSSASDTILADTHKTGLFITNPGFYPNAYLASAFGVPWEQSNLNPNLGLGIQRIGSDENTFIVRAEHYNPVSNAFAAWNSVTTVSNKAHPFANFKTFLRVTIGTSTYILRYVITGATRLKDLSDTTDVNYSDSHTFALVLDGRTTSLFSVADVGPDDFEKTSDYNIEAFNVKEGFPDNLIFHEQRLLFTRKGRHFNSNVGNAFFFNQYRFPQDALDFVNLEITVPPAALGYRQRPLILKYSGTKSQQDPFDFVPSMEFLTTRNWINKSEVLEVGNFAGTNNFSGTEDNIYAFDSIRVVYGNSKGSRSTLSEKASNVTLFLDSSGRKIQTYNYDGRTRQYISQDLMALNEDVAFHNYLEDAGFDRNLITIKEMSFNIDDEIIYCVLRPTNTLIALRFSRDEGINSWSRVNLGNFNTTNVDVRSSTFIRTNTSSGFQYFVTKRDGRYYLEKLAKKYPYKQMNINSVLTTVNETDLPVYFDFAERQVAGIATATWTLSSFYFNKTVDVFADGFWIKNIAVSAAGVILLNRAVKTITAGFRYKSVFQTLSIEPSIGGQSGSSLDAIKHANRHHLRLHESYSGMIGHKDAEYLERIPYDNTDMLVASGLELYTGDKIISPDQDSSRDMRGYIETEAPYPFEIIAWVIKGEVNDG